MKKHDFALLAALSLLVFIAYLPADAQIGHPIDLSKLPQKSTCTPEDSKKAVISVSIHHSGESSKEIAFVVIVKGAQKEFLTLIELDPVDREKAKFSYYAKTEQKWENLGNMELKKGITRKEVDANNVVLGRVTILLRSYLPPTHRRMEFKELWHEAGCTTHGPVPFWW